MSGPYETADPVEVARRHGVRLARRAAYSAEYALAPSSRR
jgi:hypothetical protein